MICISLLLELLDELNPAQLFGKFFKLFSIKLGFKLNNYSNFLVYAR